MRNTLKRFFPKTVIFSYHAPRSELWFTHMEFMKTTITTLRQPSPFGSLRMREIHFRLRWVYSWDWCLSGQKRLNLFPPFPPIGTPSCLFLVVFELFASVGILRYPLWHVGIGWRYQTDPNECQHVTKDAEQYSKIIGTSWGSHRKI